MMHIYAMQIQQDDQHKSAELLLNRSLEACVGLKTPVRYHRNEHGKPYLTDYPKIYVNWSHSGNYVICAVADREVGIDLQKTDREPKENLIRKALTPEEQIAYKQIKPEDQKKRFYEYWSVKESFLKALGTGFYTSLTRFQIAFANGIPCIEQEINEKSYECRLLAFREPGYVAAVCVENGIPKNEDLKITYL